VKPEPQEIEVEVVESIDFIPARLSADSEPPPDAGDDGRTDWHSWQRHVRRVNMRWWPLWSILALVLIIPLLVLGILVAVCWLVLRIIGKLLGGR
jgi:hypothetical protein